MTPLLQSTLDFDPAADLETWRLTVPARAACYALDDEQGRTQLLATTGNLRNTLVRRLSPTPQDQPANRIDYRAVVRRVRYRPVYSRFEANWVYLENARSLYPKSFRKMLRHRRAAWISINEADQHPRFLATDIPTPGSFGPFATVKAARAYVQLLEDLFDLCREHSILVQAPRGVACSYKQMGRCPAPCDGSVTMDHYRRQLGDAMAFITGPRRSWQEATSKRMRQAAAELQFEKAAQIKGQLEKSAMADGPAAMFVAPLAYFRYMVLQRGQRKGRVRVFLITPGSIHFAGEMLTKWRDEQIAWLADDASKWFASQPETSRVDPEATNIAAWHLVGGHREPGVFIPADDSGNPRAIEKAIDQLAEKLAKRRADRTGTAIHEQQ